MWQANYFAKGGCIISSSIFNADALDFIVQNSISDSNEYRSMARSFSSLGDITIAKQTSQKAMAGKTFLLFIRVIFKSLPAERLKKTLLQTYGSIQYLKEY